MDTLVAHWVERARYDIESAQIMQDNRRFLYVAYMCQQSIEKMLKGLIAQSGKPAMPSHNLNRLAEISGIIGELTEGNKDFLAEMTPFCIEARYGDYKDDLAEIVSETKALILLKKAKELFEWLSKKIK